MSKTPTEIAKWKASELLAPVYAAAAEREAEQRAKIKVMPRPIRAIHSPAGMIRLEAGFWFAYPKDGEPGKLGPFEAAVDAQEALKGD